MFILTVLYLKKKKKSGHQDCRHPPIDLSLVTLVNTAQAAVEYCYFPSWPDGMKEAFMPWYNSSCARICLALRSHGSQAQLSAVADPSGELRGSRSGALDLLCW